jgi:hypothetical protein
MGGDFVSQSGGVALQMQAFVVPAPSQRTRRACPERSRRERGTRFVGRVSEVKNLGDCPRKEELWSRFNHCLWRDYLRRTISGLYVKGAAKMPTYQPKPLIEYQQGYQEVARAIFHMVENEVHPKNVLARKGTFSIIASSCGETAAKIVVYGSEIGKQSDLPFMRDGVYIWIRSNGTCGPRIFGGTLSQEMPVLFRRMDRHNVISITPKREAEFRYFPVMAGDDFNEIAQLLIACAGV